MVPWRITLQVNNETWRILHHRSLDRVLVATEDTNRTLKNSNRCFMAKCFLKQWVTRKNREYELCDNFKNSAASRQTTLTADNCCTVLWRYLWTVEPSSTCSELVQLNYRKVYLASTEFTCEIFLSLFCSFSYSLTNCRLIFFLFWLKVRKGCEKKRSKNLPIREKIKSDEAWEMEKDTPTNIKC